MVFIVYYYIFIVVFITGGTTMNPIIALTITNILTLGVVCILVLILLYRD